MHPPATVWILGPTIDRAEIPALCARLAALLRDRPAMIVCDVGGVADPDAVTVEALACLQLTARRLGSEIMFRRARPRLRELVTFLGLGGVLTGLLTVEPGWQVEQGEQPLGVEEGVHPLDPSG